VSPTSAISVPYIQISKLSNIWYFWYFWYFWLTIQNTTTSQARSLFRVAGVFISFCPWRAAVAAAAADFAGKDLLVLFFLQL
jgi:hypothetical protein